MGNKELQFYFCKHGNKIVKYGFGEKWIAARMFFDDYGFKTPKEAFDAYKYENPEFDGKFEDYWKGEV